MDGLALLAPLLLQLAIPILLLVLGGLIGRQRERMHLAELTVREAELSWLPVTNLAAAPAGQPIAAGARFVSGSVVVASDYLKRFLAQLRNLVGGEVRSLTPLLDRGRREARLRMLEEARDAGASLVVNVRFETSTIALGASEIICYGTALRSAGAVGGAGPPGPGI